MSVGDHIKSASEGASHLTQRVVDAIEKKVDAITGAVEGATAGAGKRVRDLAGNNAAEHHQEADEATPAEEEEQDAAEHWADDGGNESRPVDRTVREKRWAKATARHWHPYEATPETRERAGTEGRARSLKPNHIPSQAPDDRS